MTMGESIRSHRKTLGLSQEALAERLDVSRQAVYKWESEQAQPELEKLVKMSELFGVSLDELVKGETPPEEKVIYTDSGRKNEKGHRKSGLGMLIAGTVLAIFLTMVGAAGLGLLAAIPFFICAIICYNAEKHVGLWYAWVWFVFIYGFFRLGTGLSPWTVLHTFAWTAEMNYFRLFIAWVMFVVTVVMIVVTVRTFKPGKKEAAVGRIAAVCVMWTAALALPFFPTYRLIIRFAANVVQFYADYGMAVTVFNGLLEFASIALFVLSIRCTWAMLKK